MLRLWIGTAGTGKTHAIIDEIRKGLWNPAIRQFLLVPEQYSHEAERELCSSCGDTLSTSTEVLSFTGLARKIGSQYGGISATSLDKGGKLLCLYTAVKSVEGQLSYFKTAARSPELQEMLLRGIDELRRSGISGQQLEELSSACEEEELQKKLQDLLLISEAYQMVLQHGYADAESRMEILAKNLQNADSFSDCAFYVDGFTDFTAAQMKVLQILIEKKANLTICLSMDGLDRGKELFLLPRKSAKRLKQIAEEKGVPVEIREFVSENEGADQINEFANELFSFSDRVLNNQGKIELYTAATMSAECEFAAAKILELVQTTGCRWRDITVAVRGYESYRAVLESTLEYYGIPFFSAQNSGVAAKSAARMIRFAYEIIRDGWRADDVISYLGTGLTGLTIEESDLLSTYVYKWQPGIKAWKSTTPWRQHPDGMGEKYTEETTQRLEKINRLRQSIYLPLAHFEKTVESAKTAQEQTIALSDFLAEIKLSEQISSAAQWQQENGWEQMAEESCQMWELLVSAMEQICALLGDTQMDVDQYSRLFQILLSKYEIGTIPVSLDRVTIGDFDHSRSRNIQNLLILGAEENRVPQADSNGGVFSKEEKQTLMKLGAEIGGDPEAEEWREFLLIYNTVSLPHNKLILSYPLKNESGENTEASILIRRAEKLFGLKKEYFETAQARLSARRPALMLALLGNGSEESKVAENYFKSYAADELEKAHSFETLERGKLSSNGVRLLYGDRLRLSASKADVFYACKYQYFCKYGLKAKTFEKESFSPAQTGTFIHSVLENVAKQAKEEGGFSKLSDERLNVLTQKYIHEYTEKELNGLEEKSDRFIYLYKRMETDIQRIVLDLAGELRKSKFEPAQFELNFGKEKDFYPIPIQGSGAELNLNGIADRVDVWRHDGKAYIRIVDYKTGNKTFDLRDIYNGTGMQMLQYLLALQKNPEGARRVLKLTPEEEIVPAGVEYVPARSKYVSTPVNPDDEEIQKEYQKSIRRSGIILCEDGIDEAWEQGEKKVFTPLSYSKSGEPGGKAAASGEQMELLLRHVECKLAEMAEEVGSGKMEADPYRKSKESACDHCDFKGTCSFQNGEMGELERELDSGKQEQIWDKIREAKNE